MDVGVVVFYSACGNEIVGPNYYQVFGLISCCYFTFSNIPVTGSECIKNNNNNI